jgi:hypothetical protein
MTVAALKTNLAVLCVFITLAATYLMLTLAALGVDPSDLQPSAGTSGSPAASRPGMSPSRTSPMRPSAATSSRPGRCDDVIGKFPVDTIIRHAIFRGTI